MILEKDLKAVINILKYLMENVTYLNEYTEKVKCNLYMKIYNKMFMFGGIKTKDNMFQK